MPVPAPVFYGPNSELPVLMVGLLNKLEPPVVLLLPNNPPPGFQVAVLLPPNKPPWFYYADYPGALKTAVSLFCNVGNNPDAFTFVKSGWFWLLFWAPKISSRDFAGWAGGA